MVNFQNFFLVEGWGDCVLNVKNALDLYKKNKDFELWRRLFGTVLFENYREGFRKEDFFYGVILGMTP